MHRTTFERESSIGVPSSLTKEHKTNNCKLVSTPPYYTLFVPRTLHELLFSNALGRTAYSLKHVKTITYAKFWGQTWDLLWNLQITKGQGNDKICSLYNKVSLY